MTPVQLAIMLIGAVAAGAASYLLMRGRSASPLECERGRRLAVNSCGRLLDGLITEARDGAVFYSYSWRGIDYDCSQDLSAMPALIPIDAGSLMGPVTVKFDPRNPYNSIVLCESWSGFPERKNKPNFIKEPL